MDHYDIAVIGSGPEDMLLLSGVHSWDIKQ